MHASFLFRRCVALLTRPQTSLSSHGLIPSRIPHLLHCQSQPARGRCAAAAEGASPAAPTAEGTSPAAPTAEGTSPVVTAAEPGASPAVIPAEPGASPAVTPAEGAVPPVTETIPSVEGAAPGPPSSGPAGVGAQAPSTPSSTAAAAPVGAPGGAASGAAAPVGQVPGAPSNGAAAAAAAAPGSAVAAATHRATPRAAGRGPGTRVRGQKRHNLRPITELRVGEKVSGLVVRVTTFGVFVRLDGDFEKEGLLHISRAGDGYINRTDLPALYPLGKRVHLYVREINVMDYDNQRLGLSRTPLKKPLASSALQQDGPLEGTVVGVTKFAAFVDVGLSRDAMLHESKVPDPPGLAGLRKGQKVRGWVSTFNPRTSQLGMTLIEGKFGGDEEEQRYGKRPIGDFRKGETVTGTVVTLKNGLGAFVDVGAVRHGLLHLDKIADPPGYAGLRVGQEITCVVHAVLPEEQRINLSQLTGDHDGYFFDETL